MDIACRNVTDNTDLDNLIYVLGIGEKKLQELKKQNIFTVTQLREAVKNNSITLTKLQSISLKYHEHIVRKITRVCVKIIGEQVMGLLRGVGTQSMLVGSFRREQPYCGDVDILTTSTTLPNVHTFANGDTFEVVSRGREKTLAFYRHNESIYQVDILITTPTNWAAALLYFTGPKVYNIRMRMHAKKLGLTLSEHGLYKNNKKIKTPTEESIFKVINKTYKQPKQRE